MKLANKFLEYIASIFGGFSLDSFKKENIKKTILDLFKKNITKSILKKLVISGGFKGWLISFVVSELVEEADEHLIEPAIRKIGFVVDSINGKRIYKRIENAQDRDSWRDAVRNS